MPVQWDNPSDVQAFRSSALENGADPSQIDEYISKKKSPTSPGLEATPSMATPDPLGTPDLIKPEVPVMPDVQPMLPPKGPLDSVQPSSEPLPSASPSATLPSVQPPQTPQIASPAFSPPPQNPQVTPQMPPQQANEPVLPQAPINGQTSILGSVGTLGTAAGRRQGADVFSGGINRGRDVRVPNGTPLATPQGTWVATDVYDGQTRKGRIGDGTNHGYGNSVVMVNKDTGERIRMSHMTPGISVKKGQEITGGTVIGATGQTGNTSGPHLDIEYFDSKGKLRDIMNSPYGRSLLPSSK